MRWYILFVSAFWLSCQNKDKHPVIILNKADFSIEVESNRFSIKSVEMDIEAQKKSISLDLSSQKRNKISLLDSVKQRIPELNNMDVNSLKYFLWIRLNTEKSIGYSLEYAYINPKMSNGSVRQILEPIKK